MEWLTAIPETETVEIEPGKPVPLREHPFLKESPDVTHFAKKAIEAHREVGARIPVRIETERNEDGTFKPKAESVKKWRETHLPTLYKNGVLEAPPASPDDYNDVVKRPEKIPEGLVWNEDLEKEVKTVAHKYGIPKAAIPELLGLHEKALTLNYQGFKTGSDTALAALKTEFPDNFDDQYARAGRFASHIFKNDAEFQFFEKTGLANHPLFLGPLMRLAKYAESDSSYVDALKRQGGGGLTREQVTEEYRKITTDPNHPKHKLWLRKDPTTMKEIDDMYAAIAQAQ